MLPTNNPGLESPSVEHIDTWNTPILFEELDTPDISAQLLPEILCEFATALAHSTETPEALSVMTALGVVSTAIAKRFIVSPKEGWCEPVNIYTLIALPPANNKSFVLNCFTRPLINWEKEQAIRLEYDIKRQRSELKTQEKIIEALRIKAAKAQDQMEQRHLTNEITQKEAALIEASPLPLLFTNDATPESLITLVNEQNGRLAIFSDEGGILETLAGLYSKGSANIDILLKGIDGGEVRVRRKDRSIILNPYLTIVLAVQPAVIQSMAEKRAYLGNGALERFLYVLPQSKLGYRTHDKAPVSTEIQHAYDLKIKSLLDNFFLADKNKPDQVHALQLTPNAHQDWRAFQTTIEKELRPDGKFSPCQGWAGKICGFALRIAGLLHVAENGSDTLMITDKTMKNALVIATLLTEHAIAAFSLMGIDQATEDAKIVFQWLSTRNTPSFTQSEVVLAMRGKKLGKSERLHKALQILHERNIISAPMKIPTRKPTTLHYVNPMLLAGGVE
jgi:hypothetical protein